MKGAVRPDEVDGPPGADGITDPADALQSGNFVARPLGKCAAATTIAEGRKSYLPVRPVVRLAALPALGDMRRAGL